MVDHRRPRGRGRHQLAQLLSHLRLDQAAPPAAAAVTVPAAAAAPGDPERWAYGDEAGGVLAP
eukprot:SAG22_NODE_17528_length_303_cov_0.764706_1_plen_62_part_01